MIWSNRKSEFRENILFFQERHYNCEKLNTRFHANFRSPFWKIHITPHVIRHIITPPCNTDQVTTPPGDMTCCISNWWHMQNCWLHESNEKQKRKKKWIWSDPISNYAFWKRSALTNIKKNVLKYMINRLWYRIFISHAISTLDPY
jgi:hypothetical protein